MNRRDSAPAQGPDTQVYALVSKEKRFLSVVALPAGDELVYGFSSLDKAKDFMRALLRFPDAPEIVAVLPCTLSEWKTWEQTKGHLPLILDVDPANLESPNAIVADTAKNDVRSVVRKLPGGTVHIVTVTPRQDFPRRH